MQQTRSQSATNPLMIDLGQLARELNLPVERVQRTVTLLDEGNTVPFITRYRKDQTGGFDEQQIRQIQQRLVRLRMIADRKQTILKSIESQGRLTPELAAQIEAARTTKRLEDLYLPYKPKKQTLATIARQRGLEPLAREILEAAASASDLDHRAADFVSPDRKLNSVAEVLHGVGHLLAERFSERAELREALRKIYERTGRLVSAHIPPAAEPAKDAAAHAPQEAAQPAEDAQQHQASPADGSGPVAEAGAPEANAVDTSTPTVAAADTATEALTESADVAAEPAAGTQQSEAAPPPVTADLPTSEGSNSDPAPADTAVPVPPAVDEAAAAAGDTTSPAAFAKEAATSPAEAGAAGASPASTKPANPKKAAKRARSDKEKKKQRQEAAFKDYYDFQESLAKIPPHRILAINRGERAGVLRVKIEGDFSAMLTEAEQLLVPADHPHAEFLRACVRDALTRLVLPSLEREIRREWTEHAERHAVDVFVRNLRNLLLQPPIHGRRVLAVDPGFRSGCKLCALDEFGHVLGHGTIFIVGKEERRKSGRNRLVELVKRHRLSVIAIGNGTACRQTELLVADVLANELKDQDVAYVIVNEAGASVYSTSPVGREELPEYDPVMRSAISIGRRLLDPLSELVKINPANIGVGLYQHDVRAKHLRDSLDAVVESCVNFVGVDANTASPALLRYISGLNQLTARRFYEYRREHGPFRSREEFKKVPGFGEAAFVQSAGFLKIADGDNPLDATWIHPESYDVARRVLDRLGSSVQELAVRVHRDARPAPGGTALGDSTNGTSTAAEPAADAPNVPPAHALPVPTSEPAPGEEPSAAASGDAPPAESPAASPDTSAAPVATPEIDSAAQATAAPQPDEAERSLAEATAKIETAALANELGIGQLLLQDILAALNRPTRDPREGLPKPIFRRGIMKLEDLRPGMELTGTVLNVVDFGAFVDIGLPDSGLVHISRLADRYVRDPHEVVSVGDILSVWVVEVDKQRRRVSLTAIKPGTERPKETHRRQQQPQQRPPRPPRQPATAQARSGGQRGGKQTVRPPKFRQRPERTGKPKFVPPITKEMQEGKEPMRSFSDLMQFYEKKQTGDDQEQGTG